MKGQDPMKKLLLLLPLIFAVACEGNPAGPTDSDDDQAQTQTVVINITSPHSDAGDGSKGGNSPPVVQHPGDQEHDVGDVASIQIRAVDPDGDVLNYRIVNPPRGISIDQNGLIRGTISVSSSDDSPFQTVVSVNDGLQPTAVTFTWVVNPAPEV